MAKRLVPTRKQWKKWSLPSKAGYLGAVLAVTGIILTVTFFLWPDDLEKEAAAAARHEAQETNADARQVETLEHIDNRNDLSEEKADARHSETQQSLSEIQEYLIDKQRKNREYLESKYPFGYVLYSNKGEISASLPLLKNNLRVSANWQEAKLGIDPKAKQAFVYVPDVTFDKDSPPHMYLASSIAWKGKYTLRESVFASNIKVEDQPGIFFEVLNDDPNEILAVIGFKLYDVEKTPFPERPAK